MLIFPTWRKGGSIQTDDGDWIESSQTRQLRSLIGFWLVNLSNDVVAGFPMDIVAFCLLLNIVLNHCLILQEKHFFSAFIMTFARLQMVNSRKVFHALLMVPP